MSEQIESDVIKLIDELLYGPSNGEFYSINDVLRAKIRTIRAAAPTNQRNEVIEECAMTHDEAIDAICGCAATVTVLSYQEAIEGYLKLRRQP